MSLNESLPDDFEKFVKLTNISHWIYRIWTIGFLLIGITGNLLALVIFLRWKQRLSIYIYFSFLCIINIFILLIDVNYHYLFPYIINDKIMVENILPITCKFIFFLTYFFRYLFIWIIMMINIDRCLYLTENSFKKYICQPYSAKIICCLLVSFSIVANCHFLIYFNQPIITKVPLKNTCFLDGLLCHCKTLNINYKFFWKQIWPIYNLIIFAIIPFFIIITCCILIIHNIHLTRKNVCEKQRGYNNYSRSITKTLIYLDILFPLTIFPGLFLQIYINYNSPKTCLKMGIFNLIFSITFAMIFIKNTFAFCIFYLAGQKFRQAFSTLIHWKKFSAYKETH